ncbi:MAG: hypothetical protein LBP22_01490 [Deltaproteobacteria bacterium]|jgi:hypothetical protein|nr:hypothetical protein [Deltaproteobacteria bacterium]
MMNLSFFTPRFPGPRFESNFLPAETTYELAAYETLLIELAKRLYLRDNPGRRRLPKGFSGSRLVIERIDPGSACPVMGLVAGESSSVQPSLFPRDFTAYFINSRDLTAECAASPADKLPEDFPEDLLPHFNKFGRSLKEKESLEPARSENPEPAVLTQQKRRKLASAVSSDYEISVELLGSVVRADWTKSTFNLLMADGCQVTIPCPENFRNKAGRFGGRARDMVYVSGTGSCDSSDNLKKYFRLIQPKASKTMNSR